MNMDGIRFPLINGQFLLNISPEQAMANMEEEKSFFASSFIVISLPICKQLKKRTVKRKKSNYIKRVSGKSNVNTSYLHCSDDKE